MHQSCIDFLVNCSFGNITPEDIKNDSLVVMFEDELKKFEAIVDTWNNNNLGYGFHIFIVPDWDYDGMFEKDEYIPHVVWFGDTQMVKILPISRFQDKKYFFN